MKVITNTFWFCCDCTVVTKGDKEQNCSSCGKVMNSIGWVEEKV